MKGNVRLRYGGSITCLSRRITTTNKDGIIMNMFKIRHVIFAVCLLPFVLSVSTLAHAVSKPPDKTLILFLGVQNQHAEKNMQGVENRASALVGEIFTHTDIFKTLDLQAAQGVIKKSEVTAADLQKLRAKYKGLKYIVSGSLTGDDLATEITLSFTDAKTGEVSHTVKAANITTSHIEPIIRKLYFKLNEEFGGAGAKETVKSSDSGRKDKKEIITLNPFENLSGDSGLDHIGAGIAEGLSGRLAGMKAYRLVERMQLDKILEEQRLDSSWIFNPETAAQSGRLLSPRYIITGSFQKVGEYFRIDGRMLDIETSETVHAESIIGKDIMSLPDKLGDILIAALNRERAWEKGSLDGVDVEVSSAKELPTAVYHLMPSVIDGDIIRVSVKNNTSEAQRFIVEAEIQGFTHAAKDSVKIEPGKEAAVSLHPSFLPGKLAGLLTSQPATLLATVKTGSGTKVYEKTLPISLLARDTWVFAAGFNADRIDLRKTVAAWVTAQAPAVAQMLADAVKLSPLNGFVGYQEPRFIAGGKAETGGKSREEVTRLQVKAIYDALKAKGIKYVDQSLQYPENDRQRVLMPEQVLEGKAANCIDGSVLLSSLLLRAGINPLIIITPGHAFIGWETWEGSRRYEVLETTRLGYEDFDKAEAVGLEHAERAGIKDKLGELSFRKGVREVGSATIFNVKLLKQSIGDIPL